MTPQERRQAVLTTIAARLELIRSEEALKQCAIASGRLSRNTVSRILHGKNYHLSTLLELADAMGCDVVIEIRKRVD